MSVTCGLVIPRESVEFLALYVLLDKVETFTYEVAVVKDPARPSTWANPVMVDGRWGVTLTGLSPGSWRVFVRVLGSIVEEATTFTVS